jgi:glucosamine--fructose-6-phosphate aminotransferase (isomerizing)
MADLASGEARWIGGAEPSAEVRAMSMVQIYEKECREQPARLMELVSAYAGNDAIRKELAKLQTIQNATGPILIVGMGASFCSGVTATNLLQSQGRTAFVVDAGEWLHFGLPAWNQVAGSILLTTSGESAELVELCKKSAKKPLTLICNNERSTCWALSDIRLPILAGPEYGNATKTYTNATAAAIVAASEMLERDWRAEARDAWAVFGETLERVFALRSKLEEFCRGAVNIEVIGRGSGYAAATMGALCIREMTGVRAAAHTGAGFRHGPLLDVSQTHVAMILAVGRTAELGVRLAKDCNERGGRVILVSAEEHEGSEMLMPVKIDAVAAPWEAITSIVVPQALTLGMVERCGAKLPPRFSYGTMAE